MAGYPAAAHADDPVAVDGLKAWVTPSHVQPGSGGVFTLHVEDTNDSGADFTNYLLYVTAPNGSGPAPVFPAGWVVRDQGVVMTATSPNPVIYTILATEAQAGNITIQPSTSYLGGTVGLSLGRQMGMPNLVTDFSNGTFDYPGASGTPELPPANTQYVWHDPTTTVQNSTCPTPQYGPCDGQYSIWPTAMINGPATHFNNYWADLRSSTNTMPTNQAGYAYNTSLICDKWDAYSSALLSLNPLAVPKTEAQKWGKIAIFNGATGAQMPVPNNLLTTTITGLDPSMTYMAVMDVANLSDDPGTDVLPVATSLYVQTAPNTTGQVIGSTNNIPKQTGCDNGMTRWTLDSGVVAPSASGQLILSARNSASGGRGNDVGIDNVGLYPMAVVPLALTVSLDLPSLKVSKTSDPASGSRVTPGQTVTYTVVAENDGNADLDPVTVTDNLTNVLAHAALVQSSLSSDNGDAPTMNGNNLTWTGALKQGETVTLTYQVVVDANVARTDVLTNAVIGQATDKDYPAIPVATTCATGLEPGCFSKLTGGLSQLTVQKASNPVTGSTVTPNQNIGYTLTATNNGDVVLDPVTLTDDLSDVLDNATLVPGSLSSSVGALPNISSANILTWEGSLDPGQTVTVHYSVKVDSNVFAPSELKNALMASATDPANPSNPPDVNCKDGTEVGCFSDLKVGAAGLEIIKTSDPVTGSYVIPGQVVTYTLTAENTGGVTLTPVTLTDNLSDVLDNATIDLTSLTSDLNGKPTFDATTKTLTWSGSLNPGQKVTLTYKVTVDSGAVAPAHLKNAVTGSGEDPSNPNNPPAVNCENGTEDGCYSDLLVGKSHYEVTKTSIPANGSFVAPGQIVTYTLTAYNDGDVVQDPATMHDDLSNVLSNATLLTSSYTVSPGSPMPTYDSATKTLNWSGKLDVGQTVTVTYQVQVNTAARAGDTLHNVVTGENSNCVVGSTDPKCNDDVIVGNEHFTLVKTSNPQSGTTVTPNQVITYTLTAHNDGEVALTDAEITDDLSNVLTNSTLVPNSITTSSGALPVLGSGNVLTWTGSMALGQTVTITYQVKVNANPASGAHLRNNVVGNYSDCVVGSTDPACNNDLSIGTAGLQITKISDPPTGSVVIPDQTVTYTLTAKNTGDVTLDPVTLTDDLSDVLDNAGLVAGSLSSTVGGPPALNATTHILTWSGSLTAGQIVTVKYQVKVDSGAVAPAILKNKVVGSGVNPGDPGNPPTTSCSTGAEPGCSSTLSVGMSHMEVSKTSDPSNGSFVAPGQTITYTLTAHNDGDVVQDPAQLSDDLSNVLTNATLVPGSFTTTMGNAPTFNTTTKVLTWSGTLPINQTVVVTYQVTVNNNAVAGNELQNKVVSENSNCPEGSTDPECSDVVVVGNDHYTVTKASDPSNGSFVAPGQTITYTLTAYNDGDIVQDSAVMTDDLSGVLSDATIVTTSFTATTGSPLPTYDASTKTLTWSGPLDVGQTVVVTYQVKVNTGATAHHTLHNVVTSDKSNCVVGSTDPACSDDVIVGNQHFAPSKTSDPASGTTVTPNQVITYTLTAYNDGDVVYPNATLIDDLSNVLDNATLVPNSITTTSGNLPTIDSSNVLTWTGDLAVGQTVTVKYQVKVNAHPTIGGTLHNALQGCPTGDPTCDNIHDIGSAGLQISKTSDPASGSYVIPGQIVTYILTAENTGDVKLDPVSLTDDLSGVLDNAALYGTPSSDVGSAPTISAANLLSWSGSLNAGQTVTVTYKVQVNSGAVAPAELKNKVVGSGVNPEDPTNPPTTSCATGAEPGCSSDLLVGRSHYTQTKTSSPASGTTVTPNQVITYTLTAVNDGDVAISDATLVDDLSNVLSNATLVPNSITTTSGNLPTVDSSNVLTWRGGLAVGQTVTVKYQVKVNAHPTFGGSLHNALQGCPAGDPTCDNIHDIGNAALTVTKVSDPASGSYVIPGQIVTYTLTAENTGDVTLDPVLLTDDLSDVLDNAALYGTPTSTKGAAPIVASTHILSWSGSLDAGQTVTVTYKVQVNSGAVAPAELKNKVIGSGTKPDDPTNPPDSSCVTGLEPGCSSDLLVGRSHYTKSKTSSPASGTIVTPNQVITYTLKAYNDGDVAISNATLVDDLSNVLNNATLVPGSLTSTSTVLPVLDPTTHVLTWTGPLDVGQEVTVTYQVKVIANPQPGASLHNSVECDDPNDPTCINDHQIGAAGLQITKTSSPPNGTVVTAGQVVTYTLTAQNTGDVTLTPVNLSDDLSDVLDNATLVGSPTSSVSPLPSVSSAHVLTWTGSLNAHQTVTITYQVTVNSNAAAPAVLKNKVIGSGTNPGDPTNPPTTSCATGAEPGCSSDLPVGVAALDVTKTSSPASGTTVTPGQLITYTLRATNSGDMALAPVNLTDDLSGVLSHATIVGAPTSSIGAAPTISAANVLSWSGSLNAHQSVTVTYQVRVNMDAVAPAVLHNKVIGKGTNPGNPEDPPDVTCATGSEPGCSSDLPVGKAELTVTKTSNPVSGTPVTAKQLISYTLTATNSGDVKLTSATLTDDLSGVLNNATIVASSLASTVGAPPTLTGTTLTWTGDLDVHQTAVITYQVRVNAAATTGATLHNSVKATGQDPGNPDNPPDTSCPTGSEPECSSDLPIGAAGLTITKTSNPPSGTTVTPNQVVTYTLSATNTGDVPLSPVNLSDDLSGVMDHASFVAGSLSSNKSPDASRSGNVISWSGSLNPHQTVVVTYQVKVNADVTNASGSLHNKVVGNGEDPGNPENPPITTCPTGNEPECSSDLPLGQASVKYTKTSNPPSGTVVTPNQVITYTLKAINTGDVAIDPANITDDLSGVLSDATLVPGSLISDRGAAPAIASGVLTWSGPLAVGQTATITYQVKVNVDAKVGDVLKNVVVGGGKNPTDPDNPPDINCPTGTEPECINDHPVGQPGLMIAKVSDPVSGTLVAADQVITYTVTVSNTGDVKLDPITVSDDMSGVLSNGKLVDGSMTFTSGSAPAVTGTTLTWTGVLDAGKSATITYRVKVDKDVTKADSLVNKVTGSAIDPNVPGQTVKSNCVTGTEKQCFSTLPVGLSVWTMTKASNPPSGSEVSAGQVVTYTLTATNTGDFNLNPAVVTDDLTSVLQHASLTGTMTASRGAAPKVNGKVLTWSGPLDIGQSVVITYQMKIVDKITPQDTLKNVVVGHAKNPNVPENDVPPQCKAGAVGCEVILHGDPPAKPAPVYVSTGGVAASGMPQMALMSVTIACLVGATLLLRRLRIGRAI